MDGTEKKVTVPFREKALTGDEPARCVDGRPNPDSIQGPQLLSGSLHPLLLSAIATGQYFNQYFVQKGLQTLETKGFKTGSHRGSHKDGTAGKSDCGAADQLPNILRTAIEKEAEITKRFTPIYNEYGLNLSRLPSVFDKIKNYGTTYINITGEPLVHAIEQTGAVVETVQGDHVEEVAYINLKPQTTFDTKAANAEGQQGFNLDLWAAIEQSKALGVDPEFATHASLILYMATEIVLVEQKGNTSLPLAIHQ